MHDVERISTDGHSDPMGQHELVREFIPDRFSPLGMPSFGIVGAQVAG